MRLGAVALALEGTFAEAGDNQHTLKEGGLDIVQTSVNGGGGTSAAYLAARLKKAGRDDLLAQIGPGKEYRSFRAAAIEAGAGAAVAELLSWSVTSRTTRPLE